MTKSKKKKIVIKNTDPVFTIKSISCFANSKVVVNAALTLPIPQRTKTTSSRQSVPQ